ncbi:hypothetical protein ACHAWF_013262, partial [Thalassiosira exigua]
LCLPHFRRQRFNHSRIFPVHIRRVERKIHKHVFNVKITKPPSPSRNSSRPKTATGSLPSPITIAPIPQNEPSRPSKFTSFEVSAAPSQHGPFSNGTSSPPMRRSPSTSCAKAARIPPSPPNIPSMATATTGTRIPLRHQGRAQLPTLMRKRAHPGRPTASTAGTADQPLTTTDAAGFTSLRLETIKSQGRLTFSPNTANSPSSCCPSTLPRS